MITDEALDAAARASYELCQQVARQFADPAAFDAVEAVIGRTWDEVADEQRDHHRRLATTIIEAYQAASG